MSIPNTIIKISAITADKLKILYHFSNIFDEINLFTNNNITIKSIAMQPFKIDKQSPVFEKLDISLHP